MKKKFLTFVLCVCFIIPVIFIFNACSSPVNSPYVNEYEWEAAIKYTETVYAKKTVNGELTEEFYQKDGIVKYDYGNYAVYTETDGVNWWRYFESGTNVEREESDELNCYIYGFNNFVGILGSDYWYSFYEFDEEQKAYVYEDEEQKIIIKFVDGKISKVNILDFENFFGDEEETIIEFDYSRNFELTLPQVGMND